MANEIVTSPELAKPVGYAHAVVSGPGRLVHLGGQTALDETGAIVGDDLPEQLERAAANVVAALRAAGGVPADIVSIQIFVTDVAEYRARLDELGAAWQRQFGRHFPATGLFGVTRLYDDEALIELMAVAVIGDER